MSEQRPMIEAHDPAWQRYHTEFYGTEIPPSMRKKIAKPFAEMVSMMLGDLDDVYSDLPQDCRNRAILAGLSKMRDMSVDYTRAYATETHVKKEVFKTMSSFAKRFKEQERLEQAIKEERAEREAKPVVNENPITKKLYDAFDTGYDWYIKNGYDRQEACVRAFCGLLNQWASFEGIEHYVILSLPSQKNIRNDERVIEALNAHPSLRNDHKPVKMSINGRGWKQL